MQSPARPTAVTRLLRLLHDEGPMSRATATARLGLTRTATGDAASWLADAGVLAATVAEPAGRGRPSPTLGFAEHGPVVLAVHLRPRRAEVAVVGLGSGLLEQCGFALPAQGPRAVLKALAGRLAALARQHARPLVGVGIGLAGMTRPGGVVRNAVHFGWTDVPAQDLLQSMLPDGPAVRVATDSGLTALAEQRRGAGRGEGPVLVLVGGHTGIGGALVGARSHVLEPGHLSIDRKGLPCPCGQRGCLELYADGRAVARNAGVPVDHLPHVLARAEAGAARETRAVLTAADHLGTGLVNLLNVLSPTKVVLTGFLADLHRLGGDRIREQLGRSVVARADATPVVVGEVAGPVLVGAAELAFEDFLTRPADHCGLT
ncbi:ROK family transcriptional regulator [Actinokineospora diospyrosa]|uniref:Sugar kinase of the NBD/HSP70 family, may containing an N-terminal HTH domain n=1 Tax=Actinokineospora diospyrosa TaxID=103728 RepID=A0ABT1I5A3_9PSEU|nr:ROK family protein [Actinokineospora diospyrosa]MCP2267807.1 Sugar kinase of the NBD/HSP70 family, may containing an N-terminal HTH domain [Actinokineospora diospyrosa]